MDAVYQTSTTVGFQVFGGIIVGLSIGEFVLFTCGFIWALTCAAFKSKGVSSKIAYVSSLLLFLGLRATCVPFILWNLPMPKGQTIPIPFFLFELSLWITGVTYAASLVIPMLVVFARDTFSFFVHLGQRQEEEQLESLENPRETSSPYVVVIMPVYNENAETLIRDIIQVCESRYEKKRLHLVVSFDDDRETLLYHQTLKSLNVQAPDTVYPPICDLEFRNVHVTVCRFPHRGKRMTQGATFDVIKKHYSSEVRESRQGGVPVFVMFVDSDVFLQKNAIQKLVDRLSTSRSKSAPAAATGIITCDAVNSYNPLWILQEIEYIQTQVLDRYLEATLGAVTCLPGALTMIGFDLLDEIAGDYFSPQPAASHKSLFEYLWLYLGEDRFFTQLIIKHHSVAFVPSAKCETDAPTSFGTLMNQRRRWFLGTTANEAVLLVTPRMWLRYPFLMLYRIIHDSLRSISLIYYLLIWNLVISGAFYWLPLAAAIGPLVLTWIYMAYFSFKLQRWQILLYPILHVLYPLFQWVFTVYSCMTFTRRTWGSRSVNPVMEEQNAAIYGRAPFARNSISVPPRDSIDAVQEVEIIEGYSSSQTKQVIIPTGDAQIRNSTVLGLSSSQGGASEKYARRPLPTAASRAGYGPRFTTDGDDNSQ